MITASSTAENLPAAQPLSLIGLDKDELRAALAPLNLPAFRAGQVHHWIYCRGASDFSLMSTLAKSLREDLAARFTLARPTITRHQLSEDGTRKWLIGLADGNQVEMVYIPESDRGTLCISSQVGCTLTCRFCHTGTQRLVRNLTAAEIVGQIMLARDELAEWPNGPGLPAKSERMLSNIVFMGMGEPLYNYDAVAKALKIVLDETGIAISKRKITLSTSGVVPLIKRCGEELGVNLAISLHAVTDELRDRIVPINRKYPIAELMEACRTYPGVSNARRITFEYVMLKGVNDSDEDARALIRLLDGIPAKVNLIPFNAWPGAAFECSDDERIQRFGDIVNAAGYPSPVRTPRGRDILAACGQLKSDSVKMSVAERARIDATIAEKERAVGI